MRRTTFGLGGLILLLLTGAVLGAVGFAPAHHQTAGAPAAVQALSAPSSPAQEVAAVPEQSATLVGTVGPAVPASTMLAAPKSAAGLVYWFDPAQPVIGQIAATTPWGSPTVLPVVKTQGEWLQVRLPSRPNGSTGWVHRQDVNLSSSAYRIVISVSQRNLTLYQGGRVLYAAPVGVGRSQWPTPLGPSFVDALVPVPAHQLYIYGPVVIMTASHSDVFQTFEGGDGTVGIHGYPSDPASTAGVASSHGCIRTSPQTMAALGQVPPGSPIDFVP